MNAKISKGDVVVVERAGIILKCPPPDQFAGKIAPCFGSLTLAANERLEIGNEYSLEIDDRDKKKLTVYVAKLSANIAYFVGYQP